MTKLPILYFRNKSLGTSGYGDFVALADNDPEVLNRLHALACGGYQFAISSFQHVLVLEQGDAWDSVPSGLAPQLLFKAKSTMSAVEPSIDDTCADCPRSWDECGGPQEAMAKMTLAPKSLRDVRPRDGLTAMDEALVAGHHARCPLYPPMAVLERALKITPKVLDRYGLEALDRPSYFADLGDVGETDIEATKKLVAAGTDLSDIDDIYAKGNSVFVRGWISTGRGKRGGGWSKSKMQALEVRDLEFRPELVAANRVIARVRGANAGKARRENQAYRREHCARCVYECPAPPWSLDNPRPLTAEAVLDEFAPDADDLRWMAAHTLCGQTGMFVSASSGRRRAGIGFRPVTDDGEILIQVKSRRPPYEEIARLPIPEYWDEVASAFDVGKYNDQFPVLTCDSAKTRAWAHWALRAIHGLTRFGEAQFIVNDRAMRNDVLSIRLWANCQYIEVGSDTRATQNGGMRYKGSQISVDDRPRFKTGYSHSNFAADIRSWFADCPGACTGRRA